MKKKVDINGHVYGRLTVLEFSHMALNKAHWSCICECGNKGVWTAAALRYGNVSSCGCLGAEARLASNITHGMKKSKEYRTWRNMKSRCYLISSKDYVHYGLRGISVCDRWVDSFENFFADMGSAPSLEYSIDRIDPNGNYSPENCKWSTKAEQSRNTRNALLFDGKPLAQIAEETGINYFTLYYRLKKYGTPFKREKAITAIQGVLE